MSAMASTTGAELLVCTASPRSTPLYVVKIWCSMTRCECLDSLELPSACQFTPSAYMSVILEPAHWPTWFSPHHVSANVMN